MNKNLVTIAIVFTILFGAAFQCSKEEGGGTDIEESRTKKRSTERSTTTDAGGLTDEIIKQKIIEGAESAISPTGPLSVDVEFESIKRGKSETPSKQDEIDGIRSAIYYPVRVKYTVIQHYDSEDKEIKWHDDCKFYINSFGEWSYTFTRAS